jgi:hypothetical protein
MRQPNKGASSDSAKSGGRLRSCVLLSALAMVVVLATIVSVAIFRDKRPASNTENPTDLNIVPSSRSQHAIVDDPSEDGWETEQLSQLALRQLKVIGQSITGTALLTELEARRLVTDDFQCVSLRSEARNVVFEESPFRVERGAVEEAAQTFHGQTGFMDAIRDLLVSYGGARSIRCDFKVFRIELGGDSFVTHQHANVMAIADEKRVEENSTWRGRWTMEHPPRLISLALEGSERVTANTSQPLLTDCTVAVLGRSLAEDDRLVNGIPEWWSKITKHFGVELYGHHGLSVGDVNGDGLDDLYVCHPSRIPNQLLVQNADGTVTDRAVEAGVDWLNPTTSSLFVDIDNDADQDLVLATIGVAVVMENDGSGKFRTQTVLETQYSGSGFQSIVAGDYDRDGDLDLYVCYMPNRIPLPVHDANNGDPNILWRNEGKGQFTNVTQQCGLDENNRRFSFAACWEDYDNDGDLDLYVANDFGRNNLYKNTEGRFKDVAHSIGVEDIAAGMSVSFGDYNLDGRMDLYVGNMFSSAGNRIAFQRQFNPAAKDDSRAVFQRHARGNSLFKLLGDGTFEDVSQTAGVTMGRWSWCSRFVDLNNDRLEDICVVNGFMTNPKSHDL